MKIDAISLIDGMSGKLNKREKVVFSKRYGNIHAWEVEPSDAEPPVPVSPMRHHKHQPTWLIPTKKPNGNLLPKILMANTKPLVALPLHLITLTTHLKNNHFFY